MSKTKISWTDRVWNPVTGCTKISTGCANCYAKTVHDIRHKAYLEGKKVPMQYAVPFENLMMHYYRLKLPKWKTTQRVFVNSMSDLFHEDVPELFIGQVFDKIAQSNDHVFQVLTKRPARMRRFLKFIHHYTKSENIYTNTWLGVTAENQKTADERIPILLDTPAAIRWVSIEPMLEHISLKGFDGKTYRPWLDAVAYDCLIDWVVVGCESGANRRPCKLEWIESIVEQCKDANVPVFVKQIEIGGKVVKDVEKFPQHLQIQEFPK